MSHILSRFRRSTTLQSDIDRDNSSTIGNNVDTERASNTSSRSLSGAPEGHPDALITNEKDASKGEKLTKSTSKAIGVDGVAENVDVAKVDVVLAQQSEGEINYRTMSWQKCAAILFGEYVCLAILSFPWAFNTLGMAGGIIATLGLGLVTLYTSLNLWKYCMLHPNLVNIADFGYQLFGKNWIAYELTALALLLNNVFLMGLHILTGSEIFNVLSEHGTCTIVFSVVMLIISFLLSLPRKMENVAMMGIVSAISMGIAILLVLIFTGIQGRDPAGFDPADPVRITAWAPKGTTFVQGFNAFLNILFTWVGQICYPSFIAEMKNPEDFPKALYAVTVAEFVLFTLTGIVVYYYCGQYTQTPAVANLGSIFKKISFSFVLPTTIIIGVIYAAVVVKYLFHRFTFGTRHYNNNTVKGWTIWILCILSTWIVALIVAEAIPFFGDLISLLSALFDGFFGFIFEAFAYKELRRGNLWKGQPFKRKLETLFNVFLVFCGLFVFGVGCWTSIQAIINSYASGSVKAPFTCANNAV